MISSVPISPPFTPKEVLHGEDSIIDEKQEEFLLMSPIDLQRKSIIKKFCRAMAENNSRAKTCEKKTMPQKSLSSSTQGTFTMDLLRLLVDSGDYLPEVSRKRRNVETQPRFSTSSILNTKRHVKKSKTDAAAVYNRVDISVPDQIVFQDYPQWIPSMESLDKKQVRVIWKGTPLSIDHLPFFDLLQPGEVNIASTLRLTPEQYLKCRRALILAAQDFDKMNLTFRKSDAQKCVRIDVNKTSALWNIFNQLGWFHPSL